MCKLERKHRVGNNNNFNEFPIWFWLIEKKAVSSGFDFTMLCFAAIHINGATGSGTQDIKGFSS